MIAYTDKQKSRKIKNYLSDNLFNDLKLFDDIFIAGGSCTSVFSGAPINDIDIFFRRFSDSLFQELDKLLRSHNYELVFTTRNAYSYTNSSGKRIQLIIKYHLEPECLLNKFDYTISQCSFDLAKETFYASDNFLKDLAERRLVYTAKTDYPLASLFRLRKFLGREFKIGSICLLKLAFDINKLDLKNYSIVKDQLEGLDLTILGPFLDWLANKSKNNEKFDISVLINYIDNYIDNLD